MNFLRGTITFSMVAGAMALAACTTTGPGGGSGNTPPANPLDGEWISTDGAAVSRFAGGVFTTTATDTGNKLADGSYKVGADKTITIQGTSLIRQTPIAFNCLQASPAQLNCTNERGQNFTLGRRQAQPA